MIIKRWDSFSATNAPQIGAKLAYVLLNIPMPCPPRGTVPVNTRARFGGCLSTQRARFAFGQGCDRASYVAAMMAEFSLRRQRFVEDWRLESA